MPWCIYLPLFPIYGDSSVIWSPLTSSVDTRDTFNYDLVSFRDLLKGRDDLLLSVFNELGRNFGLADLFSLFLFLLFILGILCCKIWKIATFYRTSALVMILITKGRIEAKRFNFIRSLTQIIWRSINLQSHFLFVNSLILILKKCST